MTKMNLNNRKETKSDIFPYDTFKSDSISLFIKICISISMTFKIVISQFYE